MTTSVLIAAVVGALIFLAGFGLGVITMFVLSSVTFAKIMTESGFGFDPRKKNKITPLDKPE